MGEDVTGAFVPQKLFSPRPFGMLFGRSVSPARSHCSRLPPFFFSSSPVILTPAQPPPPGSPHKHPRWSTRSTVVVAFKLFETKCSWSLFKAETQFVRTHIQSHLFRATRKKSLIIELKNVKQSSFATK